MIFRLALRHEISRSQIKFLALTLGLGALVGNVIGVLVARASTLDTSHWLFVLVQALAVMAAIAVVCIGPARRRCRPWEMGLPLTARTLWRSHLLSMIGNSLLQIFVFFIAANLLFLLGKLRTEMDLPGVVGTLRLFLPPLVLALSAALVASSWHPTVMNPGAQPQRVWRVIALTSGLMSVLLAARLFHPAIVLLPLVFGFALAIRADRLLRPALKWNTKLESFAEGKRTQPTIWNQVPATRFQVDLTCLKTLHKWPMAPLVGLPAIVCFGLVLGGLPFSDYNEASFRLINTLVIVYCMFAFCLKFVENLHRVDHLPVSRRRLLAWVIVPGSMALILGYGVGQYFQARASYEALSFVNELDDYGLKGPPSMFEITGSANAPTITAPWSEEHAAETVTVFRGLPWSLWKPFSTPPEASRDFVAWQISRVVAQVYSAEISPQEIADRYLVTDETGLTTVGPGGLTLVADYPHLQRANGGPVFPVLCGFVIGLWLLMLSLLFGLIRPSMKLVKMRVIFWSMMGAILAIHIGGFVLLILRYTQDWVVFSVIMGTIRRIGQQGVGGHLMVWAVAGLLVWLAWQLANKKLLRMEAVRTGSAQKHTG